MRSFKAVLLALVLISVPALAQETTTWLNPVNGNWYDAAMWSNGVPTAAIEADINNAGTATIASGDAYVLYLNAGKPDGNVIQTAGNLTAGSVVVGSGTWSSGSYSLLGPGTLSAVYLSVAGDGPTTFRQDAGTVALSGSATITYALAVGSGTYQLNGGALSSNGTSVATTTGTAVFNQTGGTHTITGQGLLLAGGNAGTGVYRGIYRITGNSALSASRIKMGDDDSLDSFEQAGGLVTVQNDFTIYGYGSQSPIKTTYSISDGQLQVAGYLRTGLGVDFRQTGGSLSSGTFGVSGHVYHSGGSVQTGALVLAETALYDLSASASLHAGSTTLNYGVFTQTGGVVTTPDLSIGSPGSPATYILSDSATLTAYGETVDGTFTQQGGTHQAHGLTVNGTFNLLGGTLSNDSTKIFGIFVNSGGSHSVGGLMQLLTYGFSKYQLLGTATLDANFLDLLGKFYQDGGRCTVANSVSVRNLYAMTAGLFEGPQVYIYEGATFTAAGGELNVRSIQAGLSSSSGSTAVFDVTNPDAQITAKDLTIGRNGRLKAVADSIIRLTGSLSYSNTSSADLPGLENLELIFQGGSGVTSNYEVAGHDVGAVAAGWTGNFALSALTIGGDNISYLKLLDAIDNQKGFTGAEALYVGALTIGASSTLDLNGLHLYCQSLDIDPSSSVLNGQVVVMPEPCAVICLAAGAGASLLVGRKRSATAAR